MSGADHVNEQEIIANLTYGASPEQIAEELAIPLEMVQKVQQGMNSGEALTSAQIKEKLQKDHGNLELLAMETLLEVMNNPDSSSSARISAASEIRNWVSEDGSQLDVPAWTSKLKKAAAIALPDNIKILDQAGSSDTPTATDATPHAAQLPTPAPKIIDAEAIEEIA